MNTLTRILTAAACCVFLPLTADAAPDLCDGGDPLACDIHIAPPTHPALFNLDVCVNNSSHIISEKVSSYCARGSSHFNCFLGEGGGQSVTCYFVGDEELMTISYFEYVMPDSGECLMHDGECAEESADEWCCDEAGYADITECTVRSPRRACPSARPFTYGVCIAPNGATASIPSGNQPNADGDCKSGTKLIKGMGGLPLCVPELLPPGDGDGDGDGGGGCPG